MLIYICKTNLKAIKQTSQWFTVHLCSFVLIQSTNRNMLLLSDTLFLFWLWSLVCVTVHPCVPGLVANSPQSGRKHLPCSVPGAGKVRRQQQKDAEGVPETSICCDRGPGTEHKGGVHWLQSVYTTSHGKGEKMMEIWWRVLTETNLKAPSFLFIWVWERGNWA